MCGGSGVRRDGIEDEAISNGIRCYGGTPHLGCGSPSPILGIPTWLRMTVNAGGPEIHRAAGLGGPSTGLTGIDFVSQA